MVVPFGLTILGLLLLYLLPGLGLSAAVFPERFRPAPERRRALLEVAVLSVVMSLSVTVLFGEALQASSLGFSATWSDPTLELLDGAVAVAGLAIGGMRGAFSAAPEAVGSPENPVAVAPWPALRRLEQLAREERTLTRSLRDASLSAPDRKDLERRRGAVTAERAELLAQREGDLAA
jgi:hypothetical protein